MIRLSSLLYSATSRRTTLSAFSFLLSAFFLTSCHQDLQEPAAESVLVDVTITFPGLDISTSDLTRASDKSAADAKLTNIDLKVFDASGTSVASVSQTSSDADFDSLSLRLPVGTYNFVAVANDQASVAITSATAATIEGTNSGFLYSCAQSATISGNTTQTVSLDMGKRRNTSFRVKITDATPSDVDALQFVISPAATPASALTFSPTTGLLADTWRYEKTITKTDYSLTTFTGINLSYDFLLTSAETQLDVTINALSSEDAQTQQRTVLYTRSLTGITFRQGQRTTATGSLFSALSAGSFLFDTAVENIPISLD